MKKTIDIWHERSAIKNGLKLAGFSTVLSNFCDLEKSASGKKNFIKIIENARVAQHRLKSHTARHLRTKHLISSPVNLKTERKPSS